MITSETDNILPSFIGLDNKCLWMWGVGCLPSVSSTRFLSCTDVPPMHTQGGLVENPGRASTKSTTCVYQMGVVDVSRMWGVYLVCPAHVFCHVPTCLQCIPKEDWWRTRAERPPNQLHVFIRWGPGLGDITTEAPSGLTTVNILIDLGDNSIDIGGRTLYIYLPDFHRSRLCSAFGEASQEGRQPVWLVPRLEFLRAISCIDKWWGYIWSDQHLYTCSKWYQTERIGCLTKSKADDRHVNDERYSMWKTTLSDQYCS